MLLFPARYAACVFYGVSLWAVSVLPAVLPFVFLTVLMARLPAFPRLFSRLAPLFGRAFGVSAAGGCTAVLSVLSGYPAGARAIADGYMRRSLDRRELFFAACLSTTSGPAFLIGTLGGLAGGGAGWRLFAAHLLGVWGVGLILGRFARKKSYPPVYLSQNAQNALTESLQSAVRSVLYAGGAIALFYTFGCMLTDALAPLKLPQDAAAFLQGLVEMTAGCISLLKDPVPLHMAACAFLVTFGGACVLVQQWAFLSALPLSCGRFLLVKTAQGLLAAGAAYLLALP